MQRQGTAPRTESLIAVLALPFAGVNDFGKLLESSGPVGPPLYGGDGGEERCLPRFSLAVCGPGKGQGVGGSISDYEFNSPATVKLPVCGSGSA